MSKFRVGDKFLVVDAGDHYLVKNGDIVELYLDDGSAVKYYKTLDGGVVSIGDSRLKPLSTTNTLQVGQTYTSENGDEWECIFVRGDKAWMVGTYNSADGAGTAYDFDIDGTASWAGFGSKRYNIKWGPKRETVTVPATYVDQCDGTYAVYGGHHGYVGNQMKLAITFDLIDGTPDWKTAKVTPCD